MGSSSSCSQLPDLAAPKVLGITVGWPCFGNDAVQVSTQMSLKASLQVLKIFLFLHISHPLGGKKAERIGSSARSVGPK